MNQVISSIVGVFLAVSLPLAHTIAEVDDEKKLSSTIFGEIQIEETAPEDKDYKDVARDAAAGWVEQVLSAVSNPPGKPVPALSRDAAFYLSAFYLYCLNKNGLCPMVLETVLESDLIASSRAGAPECPNSLIFWQQWVQQDMEKRARYLLSIGTATRVAQFNKRERMKYIQCKGTIEGLLKIPQAERATRYGASGTATENVRRVAGLLKDIQAGGVDIFQSIELKVRAH